MPGVPIGGAPSRTAREKLLAEVEGEVIKVLRLARKPLDTDEVKDRTGRGKGTVIAVLKRLQDRGGLLVSYGPVAGNGKAPELFRIDSRSYLMPTS
jgi:hypothetical protein